ncbi:hypothetical protein ACJMK2_032449 [Sinanodonta woodiana]|uniref:Uncharacterized protein n=1 Tax=Sinanodonta woodiana TaxID=1069815 RepID=A0ABD3X385_SINWO
MRFGVESKTSKEANILGWSYIASGVRIITVNESKAHKFPLFFYCMGFRVRSWYKKCEQHRECPNCHKVGHGPWYCKQKKENENPTTEAGISKTYAEAAQTTMRPQEVTRQEK